MPEELPLSPWSATFEAGFISDDNIFQEKEAKQSDVILESALFLGYEMGDVFFSAVSILDRYRDNSFLNYSFYEIGIEVPLGSQNKGSLFLNLSPTAPLDKADAGTPFELESRGFNLLLDHAMPWGHVGFSFAVTRLNYNAPFDAKDLDITAFGPAFFYWLKESWTISGDAVFERGRAAGGLIDARPDDISYRAAVLSFQTRYYFSHKLNLRFKYHLRRKWFTTEVDDGHAGRLDTTQLLGLYVEIRSFPALIFRLGSEKTWVISTDPRVEFETRLWLFSVAYSF